MANQNLNPDDHMNEILEVIVKEKQLLNNETPSIDIIDLDFFKARMDQLRDAFPETYFNHCFAIKANPLRGVMKAALDTGYMGAECASIGEAIHAHQCGFPPHKIVYDSPVKSKDDLRKALELGIVINLDNEFEMELMDKLISDEKILEEDTLSRVIGLRINPAFDEAGSIDINNTAVKESKFGLPLVESTRGRLVGLYRKYRWLNAVHFHVGSQGNPLNLFVEAAKIMMDFVKDLETVCGQRIHTIDIGGGLSTDFDRAPEAKGFEYTTYRRELQRAAPDLFSGRYHVITEMGASLIQKAGKTLTRIETVKRWLPELRPILLTHVGSNQFINEVYLSDCYSHRFDVICPESGVVKRDGPTVTYDIAGCLCFQGDYLQKGVDLVEVKSGDILVMHDTGGYAMSMYSKFNSVIPSPVYGVNKDGRGYYEVTCLKERETIEETLGFWGPARPKVV